MKKSYEMDFDTQDKSFPHMAENMELYCVIEELKKHTDINIYEFLSYLSKKSEKTLFESNLLIHLEDIYIISSEIFNLENLIQQVKKSNLMNFQEYVNHYYQIKMLHKHSDQIISRIHT